MPGSMSARTRANEKGKSQMSVSVAVGIGTGIAFGLDTSIRGHFDEGADSDPDTGADPGISRMSTILSAEPAKP